MSELHALKRMPKLTVVASSEQFDHIMGDVTPAYPDSSGLVSLKRHLLFLKPDVLLVLDDISLGGSHELELRYDPELLPKETGGTVYSTSGENARMRYEVLTPEHTKINAGPIDAVLRGDGTRKDSMPTIRLRKNAAAWKNAVAISWSQADTVPCQVNVAKNGDHWIFLINDTILDFDWNSHTVNVSE